MQNKLFIYLPSSHPPFPINTSNPSFPFAIAPLNMGRHPSIPPPPTTTTTSTAATTTNPTTLHSSIALLQERFRQLQRMKELREERELMKMFIEAGRPISNAQLVEQHEQQQPSFFLHPELLHPPKFEHEFEHEFSHVSDFDTSLSIGLGPHKTNNVRETSYVDTSLHL